MSNKTTIDPFSEQQEKKLGLNQQITEMIDVSGNYSETFPFYMYRKGKYVTKEQ